MTVVRRADARITETPNAVMTTFASPTLGGTGQALWQVRMAPGATGPVHVMDSEQIWTVLDGSARVEVGDDTVAMSPGDTLVLAAGRTRRFHADGSAGFTAIVTGRGGAVATGPGREPVVPGWIA